MWLVDPLLRLLEVHRSEEQDGSTRRWVVAAAHGGDEHVRAEPFDAVELALGAWWLVDTGSGS